MSVEGICFGVLLAVACLPALACLRRKWLGASATALVVVLVAVPAASAWTVWKARTLHDALALGERPIEVAQDGYVSSNACRSCHPGPYASWHASYHRTMTQFAAPDTIVAPFNGEELTDEDGVHRYERRGQQFWADMPDPAWRGDPAARPRANVRIVMATGSHHYQVYWYASGKPRIVWALPFIWLIDEKRWIPRGAAFLGPEERTKHILGVWNNSCIKCHATRGRPGLDASNGMDTRVAEIGIACEACHGPAEDHVRAQRDPGARYGRHFAGGADPSIVDPRDLPHGRAAEICGQCHGVWHHEGRESWIDWLRDGLAYRPGDPLDASVLVARYGVSGDTPRMRAFTEGNPSYLMERQFWRDGMVRVSGREYNGLLETPCFQRGELTCLSCHRMHQDESDARPRADWANDQLAPGMEDDRACLGCHASYEADLRLHTHHAPESSGSRCYNCHMPHTTYGLLGAIRSHQIDSPTVAADLATGRPNACNQCHLDQTLEWTGVYLERWYGQPLPLLPPEHRSVAESIVWTLGGDAGQRALAAWSLGWAPAQQASGTSWMAPFLAQLLDDPYQAVRLIADRSLRTLPGFEDFDCDPLAPPEDRRAAVRRARSVWSRLGRPEVANPPAVLLDETGAIREEFFYPLLARRDDRVVELHE